MSLGGLAVAIGLIIDDTVVVIENIARHLGENASELGARSSECGTDRDFLSAPRSESALRVGRSGRRGLRRDHRGRHRLDADDGARLRAAGVHRRRLRPVLRLAELVAVDRRPGVDGHQPDAGAGLRGQVPGRPADAGTGPIYNFFADIYEVVLAQRPALPVDDADVSSLAVRLRSCCCSPGSRTVSRSGRRASRRRSRSSRDWRPA